MADTIGHFCEAVMLVALEQTSLDWGHHDTERPQQFVNCLSVCEFGQQCFAESRAPVLRVEPDFVIYASRPIFIYVTHAESSNIYNFKFWRTLGEAMEQRKYIQESACVDVLFGRLREKKLVQEGFELISDVSERFGLGDQFIDAKQRFSDDYSGRMSPEAIVEWIRDSDASSIASLTTEVRESLESLPERVNGIPAHSTQGVFRRLCRNADWDKEPSEGKVGGNLRTGVILASVLLRCLPTPTASELSKVLRCESVTTTKPPMYRKCRDIYLPAWRLIEEIHEDRMEFASEIYDAVELFDSIEDFASFVEVYTSRLLKLDTWAMYLEGIADEEASTTAAQLMLNCWQDPSSLDSSFEESFTGEGSPRILALFATILGTSLNRLSQSLQDAFRGAFALEFKKLAPHGDDAIHVLSHLNRGAIKNLNFGVMPQSSFLPWIIGELKSRWIAHTENHEEGSADRTSMLFRYSQLKTLLTRAPSPIEESAVGVCEEVLLDRGYERVDNTLTRTFVNDQIGGKVLRAGVAFSFSDGMQVFNVLISSTSEGNDGHKMKGYAGKIVAKKLKVEQSDGISVREGEKVLFVLDGTWPPDAQKFLYESGADLITTYSNLNSLRQFLRSSTE